MQDKLNKKFLPESSMKGKNVENLLNTFLHILYQYPISEINKDTIPTHIIEELTKSKTMTFFEAFKFYRFNEIHKKAKLIFKGNNNQIGKIVVGDNIDIHIDFDWYMKLFEYATGTNNDILQDIWAKILANEINHPDSCSLRTLDIVSKMSASEAVSFEKLCKYVVCCGAFDHFIFDVGFIGKVVPSIDICIDFIENDVLNYEKDIVPLQECGVISTDGRNLALNFELHDSSDSDIQKYRYLINGNDFAFELDFRNVVSERLKSHSENYILFDETAYFLTSSGIELYHSLVNAGTVSFSLEYVLACFLYYERKYSPAKFDFHLGDGNGKYMTNVLSAIRENLSRQEQLKEIEISDKFLINLICHTVNKMKASEESYE